MGLKKRLFAAGCVLAVVGAVVFAGIKSRVFPGVIPDNALLSRPTLVLWYTDASLEDYLSSMALDYAEAYGVRVLPMLQSGVEFLETVNQASLENDNAPDLYITSNDQLEKAYLAGLAAQIDDKKGVVTDQYFPQTALDAVSYQGRLVAYPLYFETSALLYNKTFLQEAAAATGKSEEALLPDTIDDILAFADEYNAPETVEAVFKWDVSDIFYNYFFAGNYINVGGPCGDDQGMIDIYNLEAVQGLKAYQDLNQFFSIDAKDSSYDAVIQDFLDGKLVFTVATTDVLQRIGQAKQADSFPYEYGIVPLPDVNETVKTRGLSVTGSVAVNGYSDKKQMANDFAGWMVSEGAEKLYARTGHAPAKLRVSYEVEGMQGFEEEYMKTVPMPKLMTTANFWVQMEIAYTRVWSGADASEVLKELSEQIMTQVTGQPYTEEEYIELPTETMDTEFVDEGIE